MTRETTARVVATVFGAASVLSMIPAACTDGPAGETQRATPSPDPEGVHGVVSTGQEPPGRAAEPRPQAGQPHPTPAVAPDQRSPPRSPTRGQDDVTATEPPPVRPSPPATTTAEPAPVVRNQPLVVAPDPEPPAEWLARSPRARRKKLPVRLDIRDADTGQPIPAKVIFLGVGRTPHPDLGWRTGRRYPWGTGAHERAYTTIGEVRVELPPGRYEIWVSRGIEWTRAVTRDLEVAGEPLMCTARLRRAVALPGWWSADLHVHSRPSGDSPVRLDARVRQMAADGVDVIVATDHNTITDLTPVIAQLHLDDHIAAIPGAEVTTYSAGHMGAFPLEHRPNARRNGAIPITPYPGVLIGRIRRLAPRAVIIINHPWSPRRGYFHRGRLDASRGTFGRPGYTFDYDGVELLNGFHAHTPRVLEHHLRQWFALLSAGHVATATGNSDSHKLSWNQGGYPRNYLRFDAAAHADIRGDQLASAVRAGHLFFTTGPLVELTAPQAPGAVMGDHVGAMANGTLAVRLRITAAPWIDVDRARLWRNGQVVRVWPVAESSAAERLDVYATLTVEPGDFVVATVAGDDPLWPTVGDPSRKCRLKRPDCVRFDVSPVAVTNPLFIR